MANTEELVSVIIPAYNAQATLHETLKSVRNQTYRDLEIIVVDDGSDDRTVDIARRHAARDPRIQIISIEENSGVAHARNVGIAASRGDFIAPVDADDLWHPEKIARQMAVMRTGGPELGYVYTLFREIDADGCVCDNWGWGDFSGHVYLRLLFINFVGNGSSLLARRAAVDKVGGYEPDLHRQGAQGCEDYLIQILMARSWTVGLVPEYLTGYRRMPGTMSSDLERMRRSHLAMLEHVARRFPETPRDVLATAEASIRARSSLRKLRRRQVRSAARELWSAVRLSPLCAINVVRFTVFEIVISIIKGRIFEPSTSVADKMDFFQYDPASGLQHFPEPPLGRRLAALAKREEAFFQINRSSTHLQLKRATHSSTEAVSTSCPG